jgi:nanoRNase/pAp phosphatase (c-di-AMP/oligoRNAs hydrolase)
MGSKKEKELQSIIQESHRIVITAHLGSDADSISSCLALQGIIEKNYQNKEVWITMESMPSPRFSFLKGYKEIERESFDTVFEKYKPNLLIICDVGQYQRVSYHPEDLEEHLLTNDMHVVAIDHHLDEGVEAFDLYLDEERSSTCEQIYKVFIHELGLEIDSEIAQAILTGIVGDTGRFLYENNYPQDTFKFTSELLKFGVSISKIEYNANRYKEEEFMILSELIENMVVGSEFTYSYISDEFFEAYIKKNKVPAHLVSHVFYNFLETYIERVEDNWWGFAIKPDWSEMGFYKGSFRAYEGTVDTRVFAKALGGGGHKNSSAFRIEASSMIDVVEQVEDVIWKNLDEAKE